MQPVCANADEASNLIFEQATTHAYRELASSSPIALTQPDAQHLLADAMQADQKNDSIRTVNIILSNLPIIKRSPNAKETPKLIELLLKYHAVGIANDLVEQISSQASHYTLARCDLAFAKYEAKFNEWSIALTRLKKIDIAVDLPKTDGDQANIIIGSALQHEKQHRKALEYYLRVKPESNQYAIAQLNIALVYIRQDWWTDAQIAITQSLNAIQGKDAELENRLYTILGYSQLQQGFYRNARESFRNVKINSEYASRALLGIGTAALNQEDFIGAINAFDKLKGNNDKDMSVAQSYLLNAYTLTKIKQNKSASVGYTEAINFYQQKANYYTEIINDITEHNDANPQALIAKISAANTESEATKLVQEMLSTSVLLNQALSAPAQSQLNRAYTMLYQQLLATASNEFTQKQTVFNSYLNQSRFGLTRLYDSQ